MDPRNVVLVTGANKGIGFHIVSQVARAQPSWTVLLGSRDQQRGEEAVQKLGHANVHALLIDVNDEKSISRAVEEVKSKYGGLDVLVNNAGIAEQGDAPSADVARRMLRTNYYGLLHTTRHFLPIIRPKGKIINVSSVLSVLWLGEMSETNKNKLLAPDLTVDGLTVLMEQFVQDVADGKMKEKGWPVTDYSEYAMSKVGVSALTRVLAREMTDGRTVNCGCPGYCDTDLNGGLGPRPPSEGAKTFSHMAMLPPEQTTNGEYWENSKLSSLTRRFDPSELTAKESQ